jgi:hypothetical protein
VLEGRQTSSLLIMNLNSQYNISSSPILRLIRDSILNKTCKISYIRDSNKSTTFKRILTEKYVGENETCCRQRQPN